MNNKACWIWYPGDFELYHSLLLHSRREEHGSDYPNFWALSAPYPRVDFMKKVTFPANDSIKVISNSVGSVLIDGKRHPINKDLLIEAGEHNIVIELIKPTGLPCAYIDSKYVITDSSWTARNGRSPNVYPAGDTPHYFKADQSPEVFLFEYKPINYISSEEINGGILYDFGKELFGNLIIENAVPDETLSVYYGESEEEATDTEYTVVYEHISGSSEYRLRSRAFRYIYIKTDASIRVHADYEYLPIADTAYFKCDDAEIEKIWDACSYTFHLNSREFFLDGIKRDRWVWSGDAYQSFMINNYLFFDKEITKRTITALLGKPPYDQHINTINDYSTYMILSVYDYYYSTGDTEYLKFIYPRLKALFEFIVSRLDENGLVCQRDGDWIFIDWADFDKEGPLCAEQILLWKAYECMSVLSQINGEDNTVYIKAANDLKEKINRLYWSEQLGGYIDGFVSEKNHITRHANIFAVLYGFTDEQKTLSIKEKVLLNENIDSINTPFFKFFELCALCKLGEPEKMQEMLNNYWGDMLKLGATTIWEAYNPQKSGIEHYSMYLDKYLKSLCHAWGAGPIYLLGRYCLGVRAADIGYASFEVSPNPGKYEYIDGCVPLPHGKVFVKLKDGILTVKSTVAGGALLHKGQKYELIPNKEISVEL